MPTVPAQVTVSSDHGGTTALPVSLNNAVAAVSPLIASAGPDQNVFVNQDVTLDATGTLGDAASFAWSQVDGPAVTLSGDQTAKATFRVPADAAGATYTFRVVVTSPGGRTSEDTVDVVVDLIGPLDLT